MNYILFAGELFALVPIFFLILCGLDPNGRGMKLMLLGLALLAADVVLAIVSAVHAVY